MTTRSGLREAAKNRRVGKTTIYELGHESNIRSHRAGRIQRFDAAELDGWMKLSLDIARLSQVGTFKASANEN